MKLSHALFCCLLMGNLLVSSMGKGSQQLSRQTPQSQGASQPFPFAGPGAALSIFAHYFRLFLSERSAGAEQNQ